MQVQPYLFFDGRCDEALEYYRKALEAEVTMLMRFRESPDPHPPGGSMPGWGDKVMHAAFRVGQTEVLASDGMTPGGKPNFSNFSLTITADSDDHAKRLFDALSDGGRITMPLGQTFFASTFGMLVDRFGVHWMVITESRSR